MTTPSTSRRPAFLCALILLVCALATYPVAEIGMDDDWSYVQSARILAQTGHIVYNGWAAPILGWQLYLGALFIKLFGPSFTAIRASTLLVALLTAFLAQRTMVRAGLNSRNATIGTLTLVLSPLFLPLALSFMTDMGGLFCVVLCLYACLRALQAQTDHAVLAWLAFAALSNAVGGTVRQIAWLGVLVTFPCTVWLLRRRPHVTLCGALLYLISVLFIIASLHWFARQPYVVPESVFVKHVTLHNLNSLIGQSSSMFLSFALFLLPVLIAFIPAVSFHNPRSEAFVVCGGILFLAALLCVFLFHPHSLGDFLAPFEGSTVTVFGFGAVTSIEGGQSAPVILAPALRIVLTIAVLFALLCFLDVLRTRRLNLIQQAPPATSPSISWRNLLVLLVPFVPAYLGLLVSRGLQADLFDRYLLVILPIGLILLLRFFQDSVRPNLPPACYALILLYAHFAVASQHNAFSSFRARLAAIDELRAAGIPDTSIDGGWEHNAMVQVERCGFINNPHLPIYADAPLAQSSSLPGNCKRPLDNLTPVVVPLYIVSFDPHFGGGLSPFPPVTYRNWLGTRTATLYIVETAKPPSS
jgi:Dolichyl-phosphate-mannose-protein mannosyltransferase